VLLVIGTKSIVHVVWSGVSYGDSSGLIDNVVGNIRLEKLLTDGLVAASVRGWCIVSWSYIVTYDFFRCDEGDQDGEEIQVVAGVTPSVEYSGFSAETVNKMWFLAIPEFHLNYQKISFNMLLVIPFWNRSDSVPVTHMDIQVSTFLFLRFPALNFLFFSQIAHIVSWQNEPNLKPSFFVIKYLKRSSSFLNCLESFADRSYYSARSIAIKVDS